MSEQRSSLTHKLAFVSTGDPRFDTFPDIQTGGSGPIWRLAREFSERGHEVTVYGATYSERRQRLESGVEIIDVPTPAVSVWLDNVFKRTLLTETMFDREELSGSPGSAIERLFARLVFSYRVADELETLSPDVVFLRDRFASVFPVRLDFPTVFTVVSPNATDLMYEHVVDRHPANHVLFRYKRAVEELVVARADRTIVMNDRMEQYFRSKGFAGLEVVTLGIDHGHIVDDTDSKRNDHVLFVGRFDANKRPELLIEAFDAPEVPDCELHFLGSGPRESYLRDEVTRRGIEESVVFHGRVTHTEVLERMQRATAFVLPSEFENCPNVIIEAMASGCPVIASDTNGAKHLITDDETGILFDKYNKTALRETLVELLSNDEKRRSLRRNALDYVKRNHTISTIADRYWNVYQSIPNDTE